MSIQLAPEIETRLRAEAAGLGISVDALITNGVEAYLRRRVSLRDRSAETRWASHPDAQFIRKSLVLQGSHVAASGLIPVSPDKQKSFAGSWIN
jgi:hypothetical protein